jgi:hypothetical protein
MRRLSRDALKTFFDIWLLVDHSADTVPRRVIVNTLTLPVIVEVFKTTFSIFVKESLARADDAWRDCIDPGTVRVMAVPTLPPRSS